MPGLYIAAVWLGAIALLARIWAVAKLRDRQQEAARALHDRIHR